MLQSHDDVDPFQNEDAILDLTSGCRQWPAARADPARLQRATVGAEQSNPRRCDDAIDRCRVWLWDIDAHDVSAGRK